MKLDSVTARRLLGDTSPAQMHTDRMPLHQRLVRVNRCEIHDYREVVYGVGLGGAVPVGTVLLVSSFNQRNVLADEVLSGQTSSSKNLEIFQAWFARTTPVNVGYGAPFESDVMVLQPGEYVNFPDGIDGLSVCAMAPWTGANDYDDAGAASAASYLGYSARALVYFYRTPQLHAPTIKHAIAPYVSQLAGTATLPTTTFAETVFCSNATKVAIVNDAITTAAEVWWYISGAGWAHNEADDWTAAGRGLPSATHLLETYTVPQFAEAMCIVDANTEDWWVVQS